MAPVPSRKHLHAGVDVLDAIHDRRSVRAFKSRPVGADLVSRLLDAAVMAPSAHNTQPWAFAIVQDEALRRRISDRSKQRSLAADPDSAYRAMLEDPAFDVFYGASTVLVVCAKVGDPVHIEDSCLAAQNVMLAAHGLGLGTCAIGMARACLNEPEFRRELGVTDDFTVVLPLALGYPKSRPEAPPRAEPKILGWK